MSEKYIPCTVCGGLSHKIFFTKKELPEINFTYSQGMPQPLVSQVVKCNKCGFLFINPRKEISEIADSYSKTDELGYSSQREQRIRTFERKLQPIKRFIAKGSIIDVGCASGEFLYVAKRHGWQTYGIEVNKELADMGRKKLGIDIFNGILEDANIPEQSYNVATLFDVIEHLPQPVITLNRIHQILKDNGLLVINFPDVGSLTARLFKKRWWFFLEDHISYFNKKTLRMLLEKANFKVLSVKNHYQSLEVGYLIKLFSAYYPKIAGIVGFIANLLFLNKIPITYSAGQITVVAQKISKDR